MAPGEPRRAAGGGSVGASRPGSGGAARGPRRARPGGDRECSWRRRQCPATTVGPEWTSRGEEGSPHWSARSAIVVGLSLVIATLVRIFLVQAFLIPSQSMEDTLVVGDRVLVSKPATRFGEIHRGDVVVFADPNGWLSPTVDDAGTSLGGRFRDALQFVGVLPDDSEGHLIKRVIGWAATLSGATTTTAAFRSTA